MKSTIEIIKELERTSSTNEKINILKRESHHPILLKVLKYTYSDNLMYGFSEDKLLDLINKGDSLNSYSWADVFDMLDELSSSNINDDLRGKTIKFLLDQDEETRMFYIKILTKDLRCNISSKTINKAIPKLIEVWKIQQSYPREKHKLKNGEWIALLLKENGIRTSFINGGFKSRQNKPMLGYNHIINDFNTLGIDDMFIDGELVRDNVDNVSDNENFRLTTSIVNSDKKDKTEIKLILFDIITKEDFKNGESKLKYKDRLNHMEELRNKIKEKGIKNIEITKVYYTGTDHSKIEEILDKVDSEGKEGIMLLRDYSYRCKRHNGILKCKKFRTCDVPIVGFEEGKGKFKNTLGSLVVDYKGNNVGVGGFTDEMRDYIWNNQDDLIGRIGEVKYKEESKDKKTGLISLQFPTFVAIREEGKEISYN